MRSCDLCGDTLEDAEHCIIPECRWREPAVGGLLDRESGAIRLPEPPVAPPIRRLAGSGTELMCALGLEAFSALLGPVGVVVSLSLAVFYALRDLDGGLYSPGKRLLGLRVVDAETHAPCTAKQAMLRNAPRALLFALAVVPGLEVVAWLGLMGGAFAAMAQALVVENGQHLGDRLAGTRVVRAPALPDTGSTPG